jgi:hypothetical protein
LQTLSQNTTSIPAFQVLTIGGLGEANLDASVRSFFRHISGVQNENMQNADKEKKRKWGTSYLNSRSPRRDSGFVNDESPHKKLRNKDGYGEEATEVTNKALPKSIKSLYESILSAQKELEAGRGWEADESSEM